MATTKSTKAGSNKKVLLKKPTRKKTGSTLSTNGKKVPFVPTKLKLLRPVPSDIEIAQAIAERLIERFATAIVDRAGAGEHLRIAVEQSDAQCRVSISKPAELRNLPDALLYATILGSKDPERSLPRLTPMLADTDSRVIPARVFAEERHVDNFFTDAHAASIGAG